MDNNNSIIIISGPAGVGKTTIAKYLLKKYKNLDSSVTYTTRDKREDSEEDKTIHYVDQAEFERRRDKSEFLEWARVHGNYYGTHEKETLDRLESNPVILNIDIQGAKQLMGYFDNDQIVSIFLVPESLAQIKAHLENRDSSEQEVKRRIQTAKDEIKQQDDLDYKIINEEGKLDQTKEKVEEIILENTGSM